MKFWQAALLSLLLAMCIGGILCIYAPFTPWVVSFLIGAIITGLAYSFVEKKEEVEPPEEIEEEKKGE